MSKDITEQLTEVFPIQSLSCRVGNKTKAGDKGLVLVYVNARDVQQRLRDVFGNNWSSTITSFIDIPDPEGNPNYDACVVNRTLKVETDDFTFEYSDIGTGRGKDRHKGASSDSLKRCAVALGIGAYLYDVPKIYAEIEGNYFVDDDETILAKLFNKDGTLKVKGKPKDDVDDEDDDEPKTRKTSSRRSSTASKRKVTEDEEDDENDDEEPKTTKRRTSSSKPSTSRRKVNDDEDEEETTTRKRRTSSRSTGRTRGNDREKQDRKTLDVISSWIKDAGIDDLDPFVDSEDLDEVIGELINCWEAKYAPSPQQLKYYLNLLVREDEDIPEDLLGLMNSKINKEISRLK